MRDNHIYYVEPFDEQANRTTIRRYDLDSGEDEEFYNSLRGGTSIMLGLEGQYLAWYELDDEAGQYKTSPTSETNTSSDQEQQDYSRRIIVCDLDSREVVYTHDQVYFTSSSKPSVFAEGLVAVVSRGEANDLNMSLIDFVNSRNLYTRSVSAPPRSVDYANGMLAIVDRNGNLVFDEIAKPQAYTIDSDPGLNWARILDSRFVAYIADSQLTVYDVVSRHTLYNSKRDDNAIFTFTDTDDIPKRYSFGFVEADRMNSLIVIAGEDHQEQRGRLFLLEIKDVIHNDWPAASIWPTPNPAHDPIPSAVSPTSSFSPDGAEPFYGSMPQSGYDGSENPSFAGTSESSG